MYVIYCIGVLLIPHMYMRYGADPFTQDVQYDGLACIVIFIHVKALVRHTPLRSGLYVCMHGLPDAHSFGVCPCTYISIHNSYTEDQHNTQAMLTIKVMVHNTHHMTDSGHTGHNRHSIDTLGTGHTTDTQQTHSRHTRHSRHTGHIEHSRHIDKHEPFPPIPLFSLHYSPSNIPVIIDD